MKTRLTDDKRLCFWCPGCDEAHAVPVGESIPPNQSMQALWNWNGDRELPTLSPSILIRSGHYVPGHENGPCWCSYQKEHPEYDGSFTCGVCHTFVKEGRIEFLGDCTHALAGQTVDIPDWPKEKAVIYDEV